MSVSNKQAEAELAKAELAKAELAKAELAKAELAKAKLAKAEYIIWWCPRMKCTFRVGEEEKNIVVVQSKEDMFRIFRYLIKKSERSSLDAMPKYGSLPVCGLLKPGFGYETDYETLFITYRGSRSVLIVSTGNPVTENGCWGSGLLSCPVPIPKNSCWSAGMMSCPVSVPVPGEGGEGEVPSMVFEGLFIPNPWVVV